MWAPSKTDRSRTRASTAIYRPTSSKYEEGCPSDRTRDLETRQHENDQTSAKKNRYVWKRIKHAPEKAPDPAQYERSKTLIHRLHDRERRGECDVWYFDASGFCLTPSIPYAWQPLGAVIEVPTSTHNKRLNVLGFLTRHNALFPYVIEGRVDTEVVIECFEQFSQQLKKRS